MRNCVTRIACLLTIGVLAISGRPGLAGEPIRIMPVGDSITEGCTVDPSPAAPFAYGYRAGLYTRLHNAGYNFQFVGAVDRVLDVLDPNAVDLAGLGQNHHNGYAGRGAGFILSNMAQWMQTYDPDIVLLMIGINDIPGGATDEPVALETTLDSIVKTVTTQKPTAHLIVAQITPYSIYTDSIVKYNNYIKNELVPNYARQGKLVTTVDQYSNILTDGQIDPALFCNGINHPSPVGYDRLAQTWFDGIQAVQTPEPPTCALLSIAFGGYFAWNLRKR